MQPGGVEETGRRWWGTRHQRGLSAPHQPSAPKRTQSSGQLKGTRSQRPVPTPQPPAGLEGGLERKDCPEVTYSQHQSQRPRSVGGKSCGFVIR